MYQAEIKGKLSLYNEKNEDLLTSNVFSFLKYAPRDIFLYRFLKLFDVEITHEQAWAAEFHFWPVYDNKTEPDLVIIAGDYYLLIEAKYYSGFGKETITTGHQLAREYEGGKLEAKSLEKKFVPIVITRDYHYHPGKFADAPADILAKFNWKNWQAITLLIHAILDCEIGLTAEVRSFAIDLYSLLLRKNLRTYAGLNVLMRADKLSQSGERVFFEAVTAKYRGDFFGFKESLSLTKPLSLVPKNIFHKHGINLYKQLRFSKRISSTNNLIFYKGGSDG